MTSPGSTAHLPMGSLSLWMFESYPVVLAVQAMCSSARLHGLCEGGDVNHDSLNRIYLSNLNYHLGYLQMFVAA